MFVMINGLSDDFRSMGIKFQSDFTVEFTMRICNEACPYKDVIHCNPINFMGIAFFDESHYRSFYITYISE